MTGGTQAPLPLRELGSVDVDNRRVLLLCGMLAAPDASLANRAFRQSVAALMDLRRAGARVIMATHAGIDGDGKALSVLDVAERLAAAVEVEVLVPDEIAGDAVRRMVIEQRAGQVIVLENLDGIRAHDPEAVRAIAHLAGFVDVMVVDDLASCASSWLGRDLPTRVGTAVAGPSVARALQTIARMRASRPRPPITMLLGDSVLPMYVAPIANMVTAMGPGDQLLVDCGTDLGSANSTAVRELVRIVAMARARDVHVVTPVDVDTADDGGAITPMPIASVTADADVRGVGPRTRTAFANLLAKSDAVLWLGRSSGATQPAAEIARAVAGVRETVVVLDATAASALDELCEREQVHLPHVFCREQTAVWSVLAGDTIPPGLPPLFHTPDPDPDAPILQEDPL